MTKDTRMRFTFRIPKERYNLLREIAERQGISLNALINKILEDYVREKENLAERR